MPQVRRSALSVVTVALVLAGLLATGPAASAADFVFPKGGEYLRGVVTVQWVRELTFSVIELRLHATGTRLQPDLCEICPGTTFLLDTTKYADGREYVLEIIEKGQFAGKEETTTGGAFTIDNKPPLTQGLLSGGTGAAGFYVGDVTVELDASDETAGVGGTTVSVDGGLAGPYTGSFRVTGDGSHSVAFFSTDRALNVEPTKTIPFRIDGTAPSSSITIGNPKVEAERVVYVTSATPISLSASDATSGVSRIEYRLNEDAFVPYTGPFTVAGEDGEYRLEWRALDTAGNVEGTQFKRLHLDNTAPDLAIRRPQQGGVYANDTVAAETHPLRVEAAGAALEGQGTSGDTVPEAVAVGALTVRAATKDAAAGVADARFYVDGELRSTDAEAPYSWTWDTTTEVAGEHELVVESRDRLGNLASASQLVETVPASQEGVQKTIDEGPNIPRRIPTPGAAPVRPDR